MTLTTFFIVLAVLVAAQLAAGIMVDADRTLPQRLPEA